MMAFATITPPSSRASPTPTPAVAPSTAATQKRPVPSSIPSHDGPLHRAFQRFDGSLDRRAPSKKRRESDDSMVHEHEQSPLLEPTSPGGDAVAPDTMTLASDEGWFKDKWQESKSSWYLFLLTIGVLGLQIAWAVELSNGSPYLLSLGISKSALSLVWIAGPLSGVLVQPYIGIKSDNCRSRWGKRRPFIIGGGIATIISFMILAWTREIVSAFFSMFGAHTNSTGVRDTAIFLAVFTVYVLDFAINVIQAAIRALIVDCAPTHQQDTANAWAARTGGVGNIMIYILGYINLPVAFPFLGDTQFKVLCAIACLALGITATISCAYIKERDPKKDPLPHDHGSIFSFFTSLYRSIRRMPYQIKAVCIVQFFAWMAWFPFLFYTTTYVGGIYVQPYLQANPNMSEEEVNELWEKATRQGTFAMLVFAFTTFASSVFLPMLIAPSIKAPDQGSSTYRSTSPGSPTRGRTRSRTSSIKTKRLRQTLHRRTWSWSLTKFQKAIQIPGLTLRRAWMFSHVAYSFCMALTFFVSSVSGATILVGLIGIPWAATGWVPYSLLSAEISRRDAIRRGRINTPRATDTSPTNPDSTTDIETGSLHSVLGTSEGEDQAGVILGIHNVAIAAPQVVATFVCSVLFAQLQKPRNKPGDDSVAWVLRFAGLCALVAAWLVRRVRDPEG